MTTLPQDLRYALRSLFRARGFALVAVLTLGLGIGANTAMFSILDGTVLRPLSWPDADRLVVVGWNWGGGRGSIMHLTPGKAAFWAEHGETLEAFTIVDDTKYILTGGEEPVQLMGELVSDGYFRVTGVSPALGRPFLAEEDRPGGPAVVILSDGLWRRGFGADPTIVGRRITLDDAPHTVVGVMPPGALAAGVDVLAPLRLVVDPRAQGHNYVSMGRLASGATFELFREESATLTERYMELYPGIDRPDASFDVVPLRKHMVRYTDTAMSILLGAVGLVLLIACASVANLLLARLATRRTELAVRSALGAGRGRLLRGILTESMILAVAGGALGWIFAMWALEALLGLAPAGTVGLERVELNLAALAFTLGVTLLTGLGTGLAGGFGAVRSDLAGTLREGGHARSGGPGRQRARGALIAAQAALSVVLLIGAGLLIASYGRLSAVDLGFQPEGLYSVEVALPPSRYATTDETWSFERQVLERIQALPGVVTAASASNLPLERGLNTGATVVSPGERRGDVVEFRAVSPDFFRALRTRVVSGRDFSETDHAGAPPVAIINHGFARRFLAEDEPIGARVVVDGMEREVIGVIGDVKDIGIRAVVRPTVFAPRAQVNDAATRMMNDWFAAAFVIRTDGSAAPMATIRETIHEADPQQPILRMRAMTEVARESIAAEHFMTRLLASFAATALALTAIAIYGLSAFSVRQRTREIGVRVALGAKRVNVVGLVVRQGMTMVLVGLAVGLAAAFALSRLLSAFLYEVGATDPIIFGTTPLVLIAVAAAASYLPARRAATVDPVVALRAE